MSLSTTTKITSCPCDLGKPSIKSILISNQGLSGIGRGCNKVVKPRPDRTVWPGHPWTVHFHSPFKVKNRSMWKKHGPVWTAVRPSGSMNRDRFTRFKRLPCFVLKQHHSISFFPPIRRRLEHTLNPKTKINWDHSETLASLSQSLSHLCLSPSSPSQLNPDLFLTLSITLSSLPFSLVAVAA